VEKCSKKKSVKHSPHSYPPLCRAPCSARAICKEHASSVITPLLSLINHPSSAVRESFFPPLFCPSFSFCLNLNASFRTHILLSPSARPLCEERASAHCLPPLAFILALRYCSVLYCCGASIDVGMQQGTASTPSHALQYSYPSFAPSFSCPLFLMPLFLMLPLSHALFSCPLFLMPPLLCPLSHAPSSCPLFSLPMFSAPLPCSPCARRPSSA